MVKYREDRLRNKPNAIGNKKECLQHYRLEKMVALKIVSEK